MNTVLFTGEQRTALRATLRDQLEMRDAGHDARMYFVRGHAGFHIIVQGYAHGRSGVGDRPPPARDLRRHDVMDCLVLGIAAGNADDPERKFLLRMTGAVAMVKGEGELGGAFGSARCQHVPVESSARDESAARCYPVPKYFDSDRLPGF